MKVIFHYERLRELRKELDITQEVIAELCDCSERYLRALENGEKRNPSAILIGQLAYVLEIPAEKLLEVQDEENRAWKRRKKR